MRSRDGHIRSNPTFRHLTDLQPCDFLAPFSVDDGTIVVTGAAVTGFSLVQPQLAGSIIAARFGDLLNVTIAGLRPLTAPRVPF
jgi:hypothetical protein